MVGNPPNFGGADCDNPPPNVESPYASSPPPGKTKGGTFGKVNPKGTQPICPKPAQNLPISESRPAHIMGKIWAWRDCAMPSAQNMGIADFGGGHSSFCMWA